MANSYPNYAYIFLQKQNLQRFFVILHKDLHNINLFHVTGFFFYPVKTSKTSLVFSGGIESEQRHEMG